MDRQARLAADIGGTFTDVVLDAPTGRFTTKVLTTTRAPERGVVEGIKRVLQEGDVAPQSVDIFVHGTTLATNALIERKGAKTAFLTTEGFRDILETGFEKRFEQYDVFMDKPPPLVPRPLRLPIRERVSARGRVLAPLDQAQVRAVAAELKQSGVEAIAVGLLHAYAFPAHEIRVREILTEELPGATICLSSEVCPEIREYERFSTTCANAYVRPLVSGYLLRLRDMLKGCRIACPFFVMVSGGGLTTLENAARFPVRLVESGPAGGAIMASRVAEECGLDEVLSFDMGGTTAKICLVEKGRPRRSRGLEVARMYRGLKGSGLPLRVPAVELTEIGAGGGSIAGVDETGRIRVGPESSGSEPGPACYGRGGRRATVTDANLVLGKLDPDCFADGRIALRAELAQAALSRDVGERLGLEDRWPAAGVVEIVEENMANAARVHAIEQGRIVGRHTMVAFGGGAPLHAGRLAQKLGIARVVVPKGAGVGSAIGFLLAPVSYEIVRSLSVDLSRFEADRVNAMLDDMRGEAAAVVAGGVAPGTNLLTARSVDLRYAGQGHDLAVALEDGPLDEDGVRMLRDRFEALYAEIYGLAIRDMDVRSVSWSVTVSTESSPAPEAGTEAEVRPATNGARRDLYDAGLGGSVSCPVYRRSGLAAGARIDGPAIIAEEQTSTVVPANFDASVNALGHIVMESKQ